MLIVSNWKAYVESAEKAKKLVALAKRLSKETDAELVLAPPAPLLGLLAANNKSKARFSAQDVSHTAGGAATGEVTAQVLADLHVSYAIIGHSERRALGETDEMIADKALHALAHGVAPILCVGERERDAGAEYLSLIRRELSAVYSRLSAKERLQVVVAYEPIWAIGKTALDAITPGDLAEMVLYIRKVLSDFMPGKAPARTRVLYGGSVEPENARNLAAGSGIDGFLVGRASVDPVAYSALVKAVS